MSVFEIIVIALIVFILILVLGMILLTMLTSDKIDFGLLKLKNKSNKKNQDSINKYNFVKSLVNALTIMSNEKIGALIAVEKKDNIDIYGKNGYRINGAFSPEFAMSIFSNKKSALHDGAMIVKNNEIIAVSAYLPMTKNIIDVKYGARHRAALGMSERTDAIVFVVSETTGLISVAMNGTLSTFDRNFKVIENKIFDILEVQKITVKD